MTTPLRRRRRSKCPWDVKSTGWSPANWCASPRCWGGADRGVDRIGSGCVGPALCQLLFQFEVELAGPADGYRGVAQTLSTQGLAPAEGVHVLEDVVEITTLRFDVHVDDVDLVILVQLVAQL